MRMLFSPADHSEVKLVRKKLSDAGIHCQIRQNPVAHGLFGIPPNPELWITDSSDVIKALRLLGKRRLSEMTVILGPHADDSLGK